MRQRKLIIGGVGTLAQLETLKQHWEEQGITDKRIAEERFPPRYKSWGGGTQSLEKIHIFDIYALEDITQG